MGVAVRGTGRGRMREPALATPVRGTKLERNPKVKIYTKTGDAGITGLLLGVSSGRLGDLDALATRYGALWVASIVVAMAVFATGGLVTSRAALRLAGQVDDLGLSHRRSAIQDICTR